MKTIPKKLGWCRHCDDVDNELCFTNWCASRQMGKDCDQYYVGKINKKGMCGNDGKRCKVYVYYRRKK